MTVQEIKGDVTRRYREGQEVMLKMKDEDRNGKHSTKAIILKFYPSHVQTKHDGYIECYTYWDFHNIATPFETKDAILPKKFKANQLSTPDHQS